MKKTLKTLVAMFLALAIAFTFVPQTAEAAAKITTAKVGKTKTVQMKLYKGAGKHTAKVKFNDMHYVGIDQYGLNVYQVSITVKNTKLSQAEANGLSKEFRKKWFNNWYSTTLVLTDSQGNDISGIKAAIGNDYQVSDSGKYKKTSNYTKGWYRYHDSFTYPKKSTYSLTVHVPAYETDVYVGIAGLKNGQLTSTKEIQYKYGTINWKQAGFGGNKKNIVATKVQ